MRSHVLAVAVVLLGSAACIPEPAAVPRPLGAPLQEVSPPNPTIVASCKSTRSWHNIWVLTGSLFGGAGGAGGTATALTTNPDWQLGIGIAVAVSGILAAVATAASGIESDIYATENCQQILQQAADASASSMR